MVRDGQNDSKPQHRNQAEPPSAGLDYSKNNMNNAMGLLRQGGINVPGEMREQIGKFLQLVREWNNFAGLVSPKDVDLLEKTHLPDSLSLAPPIRRLGAGRLRWVDIGSGGGFPAVPVKIVLPDLEVVLVERNAKKAGFLEKVVGSLRLEEARVVQGNFPDVQLAAPDVVTARAIEKPAKLLPHILALLPVGGVFFCQTDLPEVGERFHVELVDDEWSAQGLRRGTLRLVRRIGP